jgi:hypothetical protein
MQKAFMAHPAYRKLPPLAKAAMFHAILEWADGAGVFTVKNKTWYTALGTNRFALPRRPWSGREFWSAFRRFARQQRRSGAKVRTRIA